MKTTSSYLYSVFFALLLILVTSCQSEESAPIVTKGTVTDIEGNVYQTITIGNQTWMIENLKTTKYNNGDEINRKYKGDTTIYVFEDDAAKRDTVRVKYEDGSLTATSKRSKEIVASYKPDSISILTQGKTFKIKRNSKAYDGANDSTWTAATSGAQCIYKNTSNADTLKTYGRLYNFYAAADSRNIAPEGWHVPSKAEIAVLLDYLNANPGLYGTIAKSLASTAGWATSTSVEAIGNDLTKNNTSRFAGLPAGFRNSIGKFEGLGLNGAWWSTTYASSSTFPCAWYMGMINYYNNTIWSLNDNRFGLSIRCIKDAQ